jgi:DNA-binding NtrC family response regulator
MDDLPIEIVDYGHQSCSATNPLTASAVPKANTPIQREMLGDTHFKLDDVTRVHVLKILNKENGNKASAARKLGIHRRKLYRLLERFEREHNKSTPDQPSVGKSVV